MMSITQTITTLPDPPVSTDPDNFDSKADAFLESMPLLGTEINTWAGQVNSVAETINSDKIAAQDARDAAETAKQTAENWATLVTQNQAFTATSNSSVEIGTGSKTFTLNETNRAFTIGSFLRIADSTNPADKYMIGTVTQYSGPELTISINSRTGTGTYSSWAIGFDGDTVIGSGSTTQSWYLAHI